MSETDLLDRAERLLDSYSFMTQIKARDVRIKTLENTLQKIIEHEHALACKYSVGEQSWMEAARRAHGGYAALDKKAK